MLKQADITAQLSNRIQVAPEPKGRKRRGFEKLNCGLKPKAAMRFRIDQVDIGSGETTPRVVYLGTDQDVVDDGGAAKLKPTAIRSLRAIEALEGAAKFADWRSKFAKMFPGKNPAACRKDWEGHKILLDRGVVVMDLTGFCRVL